MKMNKDNGERKTAVKSLRRREIPSIYRIIPEYGAHAERIIVSVPFLVFLLSAILACLLGWEGIRLLAHGKKLEYVRGERSVVMSKITDWNKVIAAYPRYRDGYFEEALLYYRLGEREQSKKYAQKALQLDPGFKKGRALEKLLANS